MASPGEPATQHLGEAETIAIMSRRNIDGFFLTDDRSAQQFAKQHRIAFIDTWVLLSMAYRSNKVTKPVLSGYLRILKANDRGTPPGITHPDQLDPWLSPAR